MNLSTSPATLFSREQLTLDEWLALGNKHHVLGVDINRNMVPDQFTDVLKRAEIAVSLVTSAAKLDEAGALEQIMADIDMTAAVGAKRVQVDNPASDADVTTTLKEALAHAVSKDVTLVYANTGDSAHFMTVINALPELRVCLLCSAAQTLAPEVAERVDYVRCENVNDADLVGIFEVLQQVGYDGWLSVESHKLENLSRDRGVVRRAWYETLKRNASPIVQISLDVETTAQALELAQTAVDAGFDWIEAGTPLILGEGLHGVRALRERFPDKPIVADLKTMDGGYLEAEMMAKAGADMVVVMGVAHIATIKAVVQAARDYGIKVMGDVMFSEDKAACAQMMEELGVHYIIVHTGFDERRLIRGLSPLDDLEAVVNAVSVPVQAVGGLSIEQAIACPQYGAPLVVIGAPLAIELDSFAATKNVGQILREIVHGVKGSGAPGTVSL
jgi:3-hexulose-6-phosphate synthase